MKTLGDYLKKERESKGVTIEEIANTTRIRAQFIEAIEKDNYSLLPAEAFIKGFLRAYAKSVGLDPNDVISRYNEYSRENKIDEEENKKSIPTKDVKFHLSSYYLSALVIAILIAGYLGFVSSKSNIEISKLPDMIHDIKSKQSSVTITPKKNNSIIADTFIKNNQKKITAKAPEIPKQKPQKNPREEKVSPAPKKQSIVKIIEKANKTLVIKANEKSWIKVIIDDSETKDVILEPGNTVRWKGREKIVFTTGNLNGLEVTVDGKPVLFPKIRGKVLSDFLIEMPYSTETGEDTKKN